MRTPHLHVVTVQFDEAFTLMVSIAAKPFAQWCPKETAVYVRLTAEEVGQLLGGN